MFKLKNIFKLFMSVVNFNLPYNFWTVRDTEFLFPMIAMAWSTNDELSNENNIDDLPRYQLTVNLNVQNAFLHYIDIW